VDKKRIKYKCTQCRFMCELTTESANAPDACPFADKCDGWEEE